MTAKKAKKRGKKARKRRTAAEVADLRRDIFADREKGYSFEEIASRLKISSRLATHHYRAFMDEAGDALGKRGAQGLVIEALIRLRADRAYALRQRDKTKASSERRRWSSLALRILDKEIGLLKETALPSAHPAGAGELEELLELTQVLALGFDSGANGASRP